MSNFSFLDFQYHIATPKYLRKPYIWFSSRDIQSGLSTGMGYQQNLDELKNVFNQFDSDKDGKISQQEYKETLRALGKGSKIGEVPMIFKVVDLDGDGFIDFKEFVEAQKAGGGVKRADIQNAFETFDLNDDGKISVEEVMEVLWRLGERCNLQECRKLVRTVDIDGDGLIDMDEFMTMMTHSMKLG